MLSSKRSKPNQITTGKQEAQDSYGALLKSIESFSTNLYQSIAEHEEGNFVSSGLSVHLVLSMCVVGAKANTAKEMLDALYLDKNNLSDSFKMLITRLENASDIELNVVNRILADSRITVKDSFKKHVQDYFLSDIMDINFASQAKKAVKIVNKWCAEQTNNKIQKILSEDDITSTTRMILTNAVYFNAHWKYRFGCAATELEPFYIDKDTTEEVWTMRISKMFMYKDLEGLNAECVAIPYMNEDYLFVIIKPKDVDGLKQLENNLQKVNLDYNDTSGKKIGFDYQHISLELPKFKIESKINLYDYLTKLGMVEMFTEQANFNGISEKPVLVPPLHVDKVLQKAFIEVNEIGTEAAAFTTLILRGGGGPSKPIQWRDFKVDRPFLYRIVNKTYNLTLFSGRVIKPESEKGFSGANYYI